jgi:hypothetical protein
VDPVSDPYFSENLVESGIEPGTSGSVNRNSDRWTTEAVSHLHLVPRKTMVVLNFHCPAKAFMAWYLIH